MRSILVNEIMSNSVISTTPDTSIATIVGLMRQHSYSCLAISIDERPVGIITERDILKLTNLLLAGTDASRLQARTIMTHPATTIHSNATLTEAIALCKAKGIRHLPVVDTQGKLSGILTQSDLMNGFLQTIEQLSADLQSANPWELNKPVSDTDEDLGDSISDVNLNEVERDLKNIFQAMHTSKNPQGADRLQSRFI